jgi:hypothetical protein
LHSRTNDLRRRCNFRTSRTLKTVDERCPELTLPRLAAPQQQFATGEGLPDHAQIIGMLLDRLDR